MIELIILNYDNHQIEKQTSTEIERQNSDLHQ